MPARYLHALRRLSEAVGTARTLAHVFDAALAGIADALDLTRGAILLVDAQGVMRVVAWRGLSDAYRANIEGHVHSSADQSGPEPVLVTDVRTDATVAALASVCAEEGIVSLAFVPLVADGGVIGTLMVGGTSPVTLSADARAAAKTIGCLVGFAVARTRPTIDTQRDRERLLFALDAATMGTWEWDLTSRHVRWSDNLEQIHGLPAGTFDGSFESYEREIHPDDRQRVIDALRQSLADGTPYDAEYRIVAPDGTERWVQGKGRVERDPDGRPWRMAGVCMDIGHRRAVEAENARLFEQAQRALAQEAAFRERLSVLTDGSPRLLTALDTDSIVAEVIALAAKVIDADGYAVWRLEHDQWRVVGSRGLSETFTRVVLTATTRDHTFDAPIVAADLDAADILSPRRRAHADEGITSLVSVPLSIRGVPAGSIVFYYRTRHEPPDLEIKVAVALGHLAAAAISNAELYAEQEAIRRHAETAQQRASFLAEISAHLISLDYEENLKTVARLAVPRLCDWCSVDRRGDNGALQRLVVTHHDPEKAVAAAALHHRYPVDLTASHGIDRVLQTGTPEIYPEITDDMLRHAARDEAHLAALRAVGVRSVMIVPLSVGPRVFGVLTLVSADDRRRYGAADLDFAIEVGRRAAFAVENARLFREAQHANRVKDEFLATLSHELRTPLNVMLGRTRMLGTTTTFEGVRQMAEIIERNGVTLARLVDDLLDVSRITLGQVRLERQSTNLQAILLSALQSVQTAADANGLTLDIQLDGLDSDVFGDPTRLQQVLWNLLTNAVKFTPSGGTIRVGLIGKGDRVVVTVSDSGEGISPVALPHVFDMFWQSEPTTSRRHGGLGLGLAIVRRLVELHGGQVRVDSPGLGYGATFTVTLPKAVASQP